MREVHSPQLPSQSASRTRGALKMHQRLIGSESVISPSVSTTRCTRGLDQWWLRFFKTQRVNGVQMEWRPTPFQHRLSQVLRGSRIRVRSKSILKSHGPCSCPNGMSHQWHNALCQDPGVLHLKLPDLTTTTQGISPQTLAHSIGHLSSHKRPVSHLIRHALRKPQIRDAACTCLTFSDA